jgi:sugar phosphate isomerase/epimerase
MANETNVFVATTFVADGRSVGKALDLCASQSITNVELGSNHAYEGDLEDVVRRRPFRYLVHNYFPVPEESFVVNIASADEQIRRRSLDHIRRSVRFCKAIDAELYTFHPGFLSDPDGASSDASDYDFRFRNENLDGSVHKEAFDRMLDAVQEVSASAAQCGVRIALETEGSVARCDHLLLQRPEEFADLFSRFGPEEVGVNLNIGHLRLATAAFGFDAPDLVDAIAERIVAMELSHNEGELDDHAPLQEGAWYWGVICDARFAAVPKIVELRNATIETVVASTELCEWHLSRRT